MLLAGGLTILALLAAAAGAYTDARTGHIPNRITLAALGAAPILWFASGASSGGVSEGARAAALSLAGAFVCGLLPAVYFARGKVGGGDVKLLAAVGALLGPLAGIHAELYAFVLATLFIPARLAWEGRLFRVIAGVGRALANPLRPKHARLPLPAELGARMRLGPAIFGGTLLAVALRSWS